MGACQFIDPGLWLIPVKCNTFCKLCQSNLFRVILYTPALGKDDGFHNTIVDYIFTPAAMGKIRWQLNNFIELALLAFYAPLPRLIKIIWNKKASIEFSTTAAPHHLCFSCCCGVVVYIFTPIHGKTTLRLYQIVLPPPHHVFRAFMIFLAPPGPLRCHIFSWFSPRRYDL